MPVHLLWLGVMLGVRMGQSFTMRGGKSVPTDAVFDAWASGDLKAMLRALKLRTNLIDRHFLLLGIVEQTSDVGLTPRWRQNALASRRCI